MLISDIISYLKIHLDQTDITLNPGADAGLINRVEKLYDIKLPDDIREFYEFSNGFTSEEDVFSIIPLEEIIDSYYWRGKFKFYIAEYLTYCDMWNLEISAKNHNDYQLSVIVNDGSKVVLTKSFSEFLERFLRAGVFEKGGLYDWAQELKPK
jgi:hypothetical protein